MSMRKPWYAVYTRPKAERKVCENLTKKRLECFFPVNNVVRQIGDKIKIVGQPLFEQLVFVRATTAEHSLIKQTEGVINFIHWLEHPAVIKDNEINMLRQVLKEHHNIRLEKIKVNLNEQMIILESDKIPDNNILQTYHRPIKIYLPSMGYALNAEVRSSDRKIVNLTSEVNSHKAIG